MNDLVFIYHSIKSRWLNSLLSIFLTAFGVSLAILITQFSNHIQNRILADGKGIDIVIGAKGSPLQLIMSSVYHIDIPNGNIPLNSVLKFKNHPQIKKAIPLALGDNWKGYRIVGTSLDYMKHYNAKIKLGKAWENSFEVVAGSLVDIKIDQEFVGSHGLLEGGASHENENYKVVGILKPTGTVIDRLLLTSVNSVLHIHGQKKLDTHMNSPSSETKNLSISDHSNNEHHQHHNDEIFLNKENDNHHDDQSEYNEHSSHDHNKNFLHDTNDNHHNSKSEYSKNDGHNHKNDNLNDPEITALLITTKSPVANINLPRQINKESSLQAANISFEITRLRSILGLSSQAIGIFSIILIIISALSIFSGLASSLESRLGDLAILRAIGYSKYRIFKIISIEGIVITVCGIIIGILLGIIIFNIFIQIIIPLGASAASFRFSSNTILIICAVLLVGVISAIFPALQASKISVAKQLTKNI